MSFVISWTELNTVLLCYGLACAGRKCSLSLSSLFCVKCGSIYKPKKVNPCFKEVYKIGLTPVLLFKQTLDLNNKNKEENSLRKWKLKTQFKSYHYFDNLMMGVHQTSQTQVSKRYHDISKYRNINKILPHGLAQRILPVKCDIVCLNCFKHLSGNLVTIDWLKYFFLYITII